MRYGYACINTELSKQKITTNRTLRRKTLQEKGIEYYESLVLQNLDDLLTILQWNEKNGIRFFRISADLFSHKDQIQIHRLPSASLIERKLDFIGRYIMDHGHRVSIHADHFTILASQRRDVVQKSIDDLEFYSTIFDYMKLDRSPQYKINVHIGTHKPSKKEALYRFYQALQGLAFHALGRLTIENDDSPNGYTVEDLYNFNMEYFPTQPIPIVFDYHHHMLNPGTLSEQAALRLAATTWPKDIKPVAHYSSSKKLHEDSQSRDIAHADYIHEKIQTYGLDFDIMFEAKMKEQAVISYSQKLLSD
jgi:UV DNA damage endonuclease